MTAFPAGEEQREFQYKSDCEIYTGTLHGWSRAAMKSSKICPILAHQVFGTVEEFFRGCGSNSERLGCAVTLDRHDPVKLLRATVHSKKAVREKRDRVTCGLLLQDRDCAATGSSWLAEEARVSSEMR